MLFGFLLSLSLSLVSSSAFAEKPNRNALPDIGDAGVSVLSIEKEHQIGAEMMRRLRASQPIIHDPVLSEYINTLGNTLLRNADGVNYRFKFFLIKNQELNAFAFFGGHVGIHTGLLTSADTESELASVLAHEISHVTQRHLARSIEASSKNQPLTTTGIISGILLSLVNPSLGMATLTTSMALGQQAAINYTRTNEQEADRVGIKLLANSGFDPKGAPDFFNKMAEKYRYQSKPPAMLLTHPLPDSRITDARLRAQNYYTPKVAPKLAFELAKARIQARYEFDAKYNISFYQDALNQKNYIFKEAAIYGLALSFLENKEFEQASTLLKKLHLLDKNNLFYADSLSDSLIGLKQFKQAQAMWAALALLMPNNHVVSLNYANVLEHNSEYEKAATLVQDLLYVQPDNFLAHDLLTTIYRKQGNNALMHVEKAEVFALLGAYQRAIDELHEGYKVAKGQPLVKKRIKARIDQLREKVQVTGRKTKTKNKKKRAQMAAFHQHSH